MTDNEIILYQPDSTLTLDVRVENDTVWLNRNQIASLFGRDVKTIGKHIKNALNEELKDIPVVAKFATTASDGKIYQVEHYNIEMITSVGYRVKSSRGIQFRQWANKVLKEYLLRGYAVNQRLMLMEDRMRRRLLEHDKRLDDLTDRMDVFVRTSLPATEGILYDGQIFDAYVLISDLVRMAHRHIILIDNYVDDCVLKTLDKREQGVKATIYTNPRNSHISLDLERHNAQYPEIELKSCSNVHDRFLIIDDTVYFIGGSIKDLGKKIVAFSQMHQSPDEIIKKLK